MTKTAKTRYDTPIGSLSAPDIIIRKLVKSKVV